MTDPSITIREATSSDESLLFDWVNRPDSLAGKLETHAPIPRSEHDAWFAARLADKDTLMLIAETPGTAAGQVRLQSDGAAFVVDIYVTPEFRGHKVADSLINAALERLAQRHADAEVVALVKPDNTSSAALFRRTGFSETGRSPDCITFKRRART